LRGVKETSEQAAEAARQIVAMFDEHQRRIQTLGRSAPSVLKVFQHLQRNPSVTIRARAEKMGVSAPTAAKSLEYLRQIGTVTEKTGRERNGLFVWEAYLKILNEGTAMVPRS
jgi:Fic family protein